MECNFWVGQKVVCINSKPRPGYFLTGLNEGATYTIRDVCPFPLWQINLIPNIGCDVGVMLEEIDRSDESFLFGKEEACFNPGRFRPLVKTDISALEALLVQSDQTIKDLEDA